MVPAAPGAHEIRDHMPPYLLWHASETIPSALQIGRSGDCPPSQWGTSSGHASVRASPNLSPSYSIERVITEEHHLTSITPYTHRNAPKTALSFSIPA